ncbi:Asp-tRNA(Asn)/Glu-tRNA(Gln) amidotransferase subunit GatA [Hydrogenophilus islandicus]
MMRPSHPMTVAALARAFADGTTTPEKAALAAREAAEALQPQLNAFITLAEPARVAARSAEVAARVADSASPLAGIPIAHKDLFCTVDLPTTAASRMLAAYRSPFDATVVERLNGAGVIAIGKTNLDEFAMGSANSHSAFGPCRNPWDPERIPGGSSGGSAAAVAAGIAPAATGTDTGGSVRQPAAHCGVTGLKPTYGLVSRWGMIAYASSFDQAGLFARTAEDCALLLAAIAGFDPRDSTSVDVPIPDYPAQLAALPKSRPLAGWRIGLPQEFFTAAGLQPAVRDAVLAAARTYESLGATLVDVALPRAELAIPAYYVLAPAEASSNLARYDGVRYGYRAQSDDLLEMYARTRAEGFGWEVKRRILMGTYVLSHGYYDAYYRKAQQVRRLIADDYRAAFATCDLLLTPVTPTTAWRLGERSDPVEEYLADIYTIGVNLAGLPAIAHPCGFDGQGLPIGAQLIAPHFGEQKLLAATHAYQSVTEWHWALPPIAAR